MTSEPVTNEERTSWREDATYLLTIDDLRGLMAERVLALLDTLDSVEIERDDLRIALDDHPTHRMGCTWCHQNETALVRLERGSR